LTASEPNPWRRLTPVGIMWGNDPSVTGSTGTLAETWTNPPGPLPGLPPAFADHLGRAGRLIGPVDDPVSSCLSCHSTAEVDPSKAGHANHTLYFGAVTKPAAGCYPMVWFRDLASGTPFGHAISCPPPADTSTAGLVSLDYSLQMQEGVASVFDFGNTNPCLGVTPPPAPPPPAPPSPPPSRADKFHFRKLHAAPTAVKLDLKAQPHFIGPDPP